MTFTRHRTIRGGSRVRLGGRFVVLRLPGVVGNPFLQDGAHQASIITKDRDAVVVEDHERPVGTGFVKVRDIRARATEGGG